MVIVFAGLTATGMALPVVPRHVHDTLGQGTVMVGFVMGVQYLSSVFARMWAGGTADTRGPRLAVLCGFGASCGVGLLYLASVHATDSQRGALGLVLAARMLTGVAESFIVTGSMAWASARLGPAHTGKVIGWIGMAVFAGLGASAPLGTAIYAALGFGGVAVAVLATALAGLAFASFVAGVTPSPLPKLSPLRVLGVVKLPGFGLTLCSLGFAMITAFAVLLFAQRGWGGGALAVTSMGVGFIIGRLLFGHLPDRVGGARVSFACVLVEAVGLAMIWLAPHPALAWAGAALVGGGYGLAFQGLGVEAVRRAPPQSRGSAMGAYIVFQDVAMGLAPPLGGLLAAGAGLEAVYLAAALGAVGSAAVAWTLMRRS
ncbi:MFS transporter [Ramlibacter sp. HM2]|uniref:MFS transporter n=2 Tax=Ramlibacter pallidus TaxID=2780087 RepID=A0ABR9S201_9BURK|nr:MFS transporter [Ramlibacter pallidus]